MKIGVYGGTFSPPHLAGIILARKSRDQFRLDKVLFIPNGTAPHKQNVLDKEIRLELVQAAISGEALFEASRIEIDRPGVTWTIDTLYELKKLYPDAELYFIMGEDNVLAFEKYVRKLEFFNLATLLIGPRAYPKQSSLDEWRKLLPEAKIEMVDIEASGLASREIRELVRTGGDYCSHVTAEVCRIIRERGLYLDSPPKPEAPTNPA